MSREPQSEPASDDRAAVPFVDLETLLDARRDGRDVPVIDLRAPVEYADDRVPGAVNVPLFEDETRAFIGLLYKQFSPEAAFQEGRAAVAGRVEELVGEVHRVAGREAPPTDDLVRRVLDMTGGGIERLERELVPEAQPTLRDDAIVLSCARGGLRSRSVVALLRAIGLEGAVGLESGYRAWRGRVRASLDDWRAPSHVIVLRGLTGVGKTLVLREIERRRPGWTLDLEGLAGHRSSLLGMVGLDPVSQKEFESRLAERLEAGFPDDVMVVEGESRKVGDVVIPPAVWDAMRAGTSLELTASVDTRVRVLTEDYLSDPSALPLLREQLVRVSERMAGSPDLAAMFDRGEIDALVRVLLERYYDPLYTRSEAGYTYAATFSTDSANEAARGVVRYTEGLCSPRTLDSPSHRDNSASP